MKLWREHYAPHRLAVAGEPGGLNVVATRTADGKAIYVKAVNPTAEAADVRLEVKGGFQAADAGMELVAPDSLSARNSLERPHAIHPLPGKVSRNGQVLEVALPRWSAAVVTIRSQ
jgi:alpha-L-arabinofuranosidase